VPPGGLIEATLRLQRPGSPTVHGREEPVEVPIRDLSDAALRGVVESFVNREGTDYGAVERTLDEKVAQVMRALETGRARLVFDPETESIQILAES